MGNRSGCGVACLGDNVHIEDDGKTRYAPREWNRPPPNEQEKPETTSSKVNFSDKYRKEEVSEQELRSSYNRESHYLRDRDKYESKIWGEEQNR